MKNTMLFAFFALFASPILGVACTSMPVFTTDTPLIMGPASNFDTFTSDGTGANQSIEWTCTAQDNSASAISIDAGYEANSLKTANICVIEYPAFIISARTNEVFFWSFSADGKMKKSDGTLMNTVIEGDAFSPKTAFYYPAV